jgi:hypothetical protein
LSADHHQDRKHRNFVGFILWRAATREACANGGRVFFVVTENFMNEVFRLTNAVLVAQADAYYNGALPQSCAIADHGSVVHEMLESPEQEAAKHAAGEEPYNEA